MWQKTWLAHYPVGRSPEGINVSPDGQWIYVANQDDNLVYIIDTATHSLQGRVRTSSVPIRVTFSPNGRNKFRHSYLSTTFVEVST